MKYEVLDGFFFTKDYRKEKTAHKKKETWADHLELIVGPSP